MIHFAQKYPSGWNISSPPILLWGILYFAAPAQITHWPYIVTVFRRPRNRVFGTGEDWNQYRRSLPYLVIFQGNSVIVQSKKVIEDLMPDKKTTLTICMAKQNKIWTRASLEAVDRKIAMQPTLEYMRTVRTNLSVENVLRQIRSRTWQNIHYWYTSPRPTTTQDELIALNNQST